MLCSQLCALPGSLPGFLWFITKTRRKSGDWQRWWAHTWMAARTTASRKVYIHTTHALGQDAHGVPCVLRTLTLTLELSLNLNIYDLLTPTICSRKEAKSWATSVHRFTSPQCKHTHDHTSKFTSVLQLPRLIYYDMCCSFTNKQPNCH